MCRWLVSAVVLCLLATGCGTVARNETSPSPQNDQRVRAQQTAPRKEVISNPKKVAAHLESLAKHVPGVKSAHCVVFQNTAIVGINVDGKLERAEVGTIKYAVAEAFRKDKYGINAVVTADIDLSNRLREMRNDFQRGRPIAGFAEELADIIGRIVPQMPRDTKPRNTEPDTRTGTKINKSL
ncbi:YhcN/YlaJ family sporulation lipoprotein [Paenibacillus oenotherae]|uniref:YhcN/YlaJ family sporulation lipoprotein n=1 Tax=Paenibacillus oenotherae TaxID=1435645 RepID=A0ABS7D153_9BACL|nr:YhcN/YlaJ family sporulation lipoprotein [Paenibacillus oenotherae]MBW7473672.1 YhcN/YlaJ family sporulation lipoprotein [Paenibacillus oenotherae]